MKINIIMGQSDLGTHVCGSELGPSRIIKQIDSKKINKIYTINKKEVNKSLDRLDLAKNLVEVNEVTKGVFDSVCETIKDNCFPITLGGDHSVVVGSILASNKYNDIGVIWIDAHGDYNTFETTITGNLHGLPLAAVSGYKCDKLTSFINSRFVNPKNCVIVGARSIDPLELVNIKDSGVTIFTMDDIKANGIHNIMKKAISIANNNTNGIHISYDLDVIDPKFAPGVSIPEINGISYEESIEIMDEIVKNINLIKSFDLVELNPLRDIDNKTLDIACILLNNFIKKQ